MYRRLENLFQWILLWGLVFILITEYYKQSYHSKKAGPHSRQNNDYNHLALPENNQAIRENLVNGSSYTVQNHDHTTGKALKENSVYLILERIVSGGMLDPLNEYHVISDLVTPIATVERAKRMDTSICTHATTSNLHYLTNLSKRWEAPISIAVFSYDLQIRNTLRQILYLHACHPSIRNHVTFHLVMPRFNQIVITYESLNMPIECSPMGHLVNVSRSKNFQDTGHPYPQNTLRTVAITHSKTNFIFTVDIDLLPSKGLARDFQKLIEGKTSPKFDKTALVIPAFEAKQHLTFVNTKIDLLREMNKGNIRVYYSTVCRSCQEATNYTRWLPIPMSSDTEIAYHVAHAPSWEPFYIANKRDLPLYDGRFKQYGFNRISQACETHLSGFQFAVTNTGFVVHDGFKTKSNFHKSRIQELRKNKILYEKIKEEWRIKYLHSRRSC